MVLMEFSVAPMNAGDSVSPYVARCVELVAASGLDYQLHAMGTLVEGELPELLELLRRCMDAVTADCDRVTCTAKFDSRKESSGRIAGKVASVAAKIGRTLKT